MKPAPSKSAPAKSPPAKAGATKAAPKARPRTPALGRPPGKFTQHKKLAALRDVLEKQPQGMTVPEIVAYLHLTTRSVRRYLKYLRNATGADALQSTPHGPRGALLWRINPKDLGRAMNLRRTQAYSLLAVRRAFDALRGSALNEELEIVTQQMLQLARRPVRAGGAADIANDTRLEERFVLGQETFVAPVHRGGELDDVFRAVADLRVLTFRYLPAKRVPGERGVRMTIHPYAMVLYRGGVHCIARDAATGRVEPYALSRMRESEPSESARFELPVDFKVDDYVHGPFGLGRAVHPIVVEFSAQVGEEIRGQRVHPGQRLATSPDGRVRLSVTVPSLEEALAWVLRFGASAQVIEPRELREAVVRELESAIARYPR